MKKRGEITVFLSLTLVCILSLFMGLLESARTAGARLYLTMAANSAMASVMSQYNRNLWDMYHLLFLEYESPEAIGRSFDTYLDFYLEQENLYPMKRKSREVTAILNMQDHAGSCRRSRHTFRAALDTILCGGRNHTGRSAQNRHGTCRGGIRRQV